MLGYNPTVVLPQNLQPSWFSSCVLWLKSNLGIITSTGVSTWTDQSGQGNNVTQGTGANQPSYSLIGGPNGGPALTFNGSTQVLDGSTAPFTVANSWTLFLVHKFSAPGGCVYSCGGGGGNGLSLFQQVVQAKREVNFNGIGTDEGTGTTLNYGTWEVWTVTNNSAGPLQTLSVNGIAQTLSPNSTSPATTQTIQSVGSRSDALLLNGSVAEIIAFNTLLSSNQITEVQNYLLGAYGFTF